MAWARPGILCMRAALQKAFQTSKTQYDKNISMIYKFDLKQNSARKIYEYLKSRSCSYFRRGKLILPGGATYLGKFRAGQPVGKGRLVDLAKKKGRGKFSSMSEVLNRFVFLFVCHSADMFSPECSPRSAMWISPSLTQW